MSVATARIVGKGHPWVIRDRDTGDLSAHRPGDIVDLVAPGGSWVATAVVDPENLICARVLGRVQAGSVNDEELNRRLHEAVANRQSLLETRTTTAFRLVHGSADGLPGLFVDLWDEVLVATRTTAAIARLTLPVYEALQARFQGMALYEQDHFEDLRSGSNPLDAVLSGRWVRKPKGVDMLERWSVLERGFHFHVTPLSGLTTGLYPDQRRNRQRLAEIIGGQDRPRIANTFSHTGAFSVACAAAGAGQVVSLDLARRYCTWAEDNLRANDLDPEQHPVLQEDALEWLGKPGEPFDGFILDPPAHARSRRRRGAGWNLKRDLRSLVAAAARRANPAAWMLCCVNLKGRSRAFLKDQVRAGLSAAGRKATRQDGAPAGLDFPRVQGFPESRPFEGLLVHLD